MGTSNIPGATNGTNLDAGDHNATRDALLIDHVPRNSSGIATSLAGSLGTSLLKWANAHVNKYFIGLLASNLTIEDDTGDMLFKVDGTEILRLASTGLTATFGAGVIPVLNKQTFTGNGTFNVSATVDELYVFMAGGGGGGGSGAGGNTSTGGGGAGGGGAQQIFATVTVTPSAALSVVIGAGGTGGALVNTGDGNPGTQGVSSTFSGFTAEGGLSGSAGQTGGGATGTSTEWKTLLNNVGSGNGGAANNDGTVGEASFYGAGGAKGLGTAAQNGGGGGGGGGNGAGGDGGDGGNTGGAPGDVGGTSAGGGGGGGSGVSPNNSGAGGDGGDGIVIVMWVD